MLIRLVFLVGLIASLGSQPVEAAELKPLTVENYCNLTVERLELARSSWYWLKAAPTDVQLQALWEKYNTNEKEYLRFASKNRQKLEQHLEKHADLKQKIDQLSEEIKLYIKQGVDPR
jgi:hypothetical protein